jgi:hypothetical protein
VILRLARTQREAAREQLRALDPAAQAALCLDVRPEVRPELLMLLDHPERVVPLLPEAELCITARASGMSDAAFLLELGTNDQVQACFDLDCWAPVGVVEVDRVDEWIDALIEAGPETVARAFEHVDLEIWLLALRAQTEVAVLGKEDERPEGWWTIDGTVYWGPRGDVDPARVQEIARALFDQFPTSYWRAVYGMLFESPIECEEFARRWRNGRLADQGFPDRDQAMELYRPLRPEDAPIWDYLGETDALVEINSLPATLQGTLLGEALARLPAARAGDVLGYVLAVANGVAVADGRRLSDADCIPGAIEKAVRGIDRGLRELAKVRNQPSEQVLDSTPPADLFRVAVAIDPELTPEPISVEPLLAEDEDDEEDDA